MRHWLKIQGSFAGLGGRVYHEGSAINDEFPSILYTPSRKELFVKKKSVKTISIPFRPELYI